MPSSNNYIIETYNLSKHFGKIKAVDNLNLSIKEGEIFGFLGPNGAGKTTVIRMLCGILIPTSGTAEVCGYDILKEPESIKSHIGYVSQKFSLYQDLTVGENIDFFMDIFGVYGDERENRRERYLGFSNLQPFIKRKAGDLSGGMKQKLGLACVLVHQPKVLVLDEPTNGVDPISRQEFWDILSEMRAEGMTILISTAYLDEGEMCDDLALMHKSKVIAHAAPSEMGFGFKSLEEAMIHRIQEADSELAYDAFKR